MNLLAIDTATEVCSVALLSGVDTLGIYQETARDHSRLILSMIDQLMADAELKPAQISGLAFGRGPGSFTGVRIAAGVAQGIALAADCPVVPVSDLAAMAQRCYREKGEKAVLAAIDARMSEVYWGGFLVDDDGLVTPCIDECVCPPDSVPLPLPGTAKGWFGAGTGWMSYSEALVTATTRLNVVSHAHCLPDALDILTLAKRDLEQGGGLSAELAQPVYLRDKVAKTLSERGVTPDP